MCVSVVLVTKLFLGKNTLNPPSSFHNDSPSVEDDTKPYMQGQGNPRCLVATMYTVNTKYRLCVYRLLYKRYVTIYHCLDGMIDVSVFCSLRSILSFKNEWL